MYSLLRLFMATMSVACRFGRRGSLDKGRLRLPPKRRIRHTLKDSIRVSKLMLPSLRRAPLSRLSLVLSSVATRAAAQAYQTSCPARRRRCEAVIHWSCFVTDLTNQLWSAGWSIMIGLPR
eukprot:scaffold3978_cov291-Pinguiococcus_pyrenoidosus.AAC.1